MHYKTYLNIIRLGLMSYYNMDERHKTTHTIKNEASGSTEVCTVVIGKK